MLITPYQGKADIMNARPLNSFIALIEFDNSIHTHQAQIATYTKEITHYADLEKALSGDLEKLKSHWHELKKRVDSHELEMKSLDDQIAKKKHILENVTSHKEYQSLKSEIETIKKAQHALEDTLLAAWNEVENARKQHDQAHAAAQQKRADWHQKIIELQEKSAQIQAQVKELLMQREEKLLGIPAEWLEKYIQMQARVKDPVVPVVNGSCSACFFSVSPVDMAGLKRRKLIQCKDCFRLLYIPGLTDALDDLDI